MVAAEEDHRSLGALAEVGGPCQVPEEEVAEEAGAEVRTSQVEEVAEVGAGAGAKKTMLATSAAGAVVAVVEEVVEAGEQDCCLI